MYQKKLPPETLCPFEYALAIIGGKWDTRILCLLAHNESMRFGRFKSILTGISDTALSNVLKNFIKHGIIVRNEFEEQPPHVEYCLTARGRELVPILQELCQWSIKSNESPELPDISLCEECKYGIEL